MMLQFQVRIAKTGRAGDRPTPGRFTKQAKKIFEQIRSLSKNSDDAMNLNTLLNIADLYFETNQLDKSAIEYKRVIQSDPSSYIAYFKLGVIAEQKKEIDQAINFYKRALDLNPDLPEVWNNLGLLLKKTSRTDAGIRCFQKAVDSAPDFYQAYYNLGGAYAAKNKLNRAIACLKKVIEINPDYVSAITQLGMLFQKTNNYSDALKYYHRALEHEPENDKLYILIGEIYKQLKRDDQAMVFLEKATAINPTNASSLFNMAKIHKRKGNAEKAIELYHRLLELEPDSMASLINLAGAYAYLNRMNEAISYARKALIIDPQHADVYNNIGVYYRGIGEMETALSHLKQAIKIDPELAEAHLNLAVTYLLMGDFEKGWREYEWRFKVDEYTSYGRHSDISTWDGKPFPGQTLLVYDEQGFGDTFQFIRYLPMVKKLGGHVVFEVKSGILPLIKNVPGVDEWIEREKGSDAAISVDMVIPLLSIPGKIGTTLRSIPAEVPYLFPLAERKTKFEHLLNNKGKKVGIAWAGSKQHPNDANRSLELGFFKCLTDISGLSFYSLQKEISVQEKTMLEEMRVHDLGSSFADFTDTATAIGYLDLVISVDTSIVHLAGAMGKIAWVVLPFEPDWRWLLNSSKSPWYPTISLFRQKRRGEWPPVFEEIRQKVKADYHF